MRALAWLFTLLLAGFLAVELAFYWLYPEARFGLFGLGPYPLWAWLAAGFAWGALAIFLWLPALHLRARAERRRILAELKATKEALEDYRRRYPEELPRIPDREPEPEPESE